MKARFWAEELAERALTRHAAPYVVSDWKTPSGHIHVGSLRGVLVHDAVARALRNAGHETRYVYGFDDADPFEKAPSYLDQTAYAPYLGQPLSTVPAPGSDGRPLSDVGPESSYAHVYADEFEAVYRRLGVDSETLRTSELYQSGFFDAAIRLVLDYASDIRAAYEAVLTEHRSADRRDKAVVAQFPITILCQGCRKIATTEITSWDGSQVLYRCPTDRRVAPNVDGCGHEGSVAPFGGAAKLPWKVEWAAKWWLLKSDVEGAGKDHYTKGGSREVAAEIFRRVFAPQAEAGYDRIPEDLFYEWFYLSGRKMSTSQGVGVFARDILDQIPAELLRFLMVRVRPRSGVDFDPSPTTIGQLFDEYDRILAGAVADDQSQEGAILRAAAIEPRELPRFVIRHSKVVSLLTHNAKSPDEVRAIAAEERGSPLAPAEQRELDRRIEFAQAHTVSTESPQSSQLLENDQRLFLAELMDRLHSVDTEVWRANRLRDAVYDTKSETGIESKRAFQAIYRALLGTDAGPRVGDLFVQRGRERTLDALRKAME